MTLKNHELTWQFNVNQVTSGSTQDLANKALMFALKNSLIGFAVNPWTVAGSSDAVTAGIDAVDRWETTGDIVWSTGNRSWIILKQTGLSSNFQLLIALNSAFNYSYNVGIIQFSPSAGFTGGAINANPTATDAVTILSADTAWGGRSGSVDTTMCSVLHAMQSEDGYCTRIFACRDDAPGYPILYWSFERIKNAVPEITYPYICNAKGGSAAPATKFNSYGAYRAFTNTSAPWKFSYNSAAVDVQFSAEGMGSYLLVSQLQNRNDISGDYDVYPCGIVSLIAAYKGRFGEVYDFFLAPANTHLFYYNDADNNDKKWVQLANMIVPWNGTYITIG